MTNSLYIQNSVKYSWKITKKLRNRGGNKREKIRKKDM